MSLIQSIPIRPQRWAPALAASLALPVLLLWGGWATAGEQGPRQPPGAADLVADPADITMAGETITVTVSNRGNLAAGATTIKLTDHPPLQDSGDDRPGFPRHRILPGECALVLWPEPGPDAWRLRLRWSGADPGDSFSGALRLETGTGDIITITQVTPVGAAHKGTARLEDGWLTWDAETGVRPAGLDLLIADQAKPAALLITDPRINGASSPAQVYIGNWWLSRYLAQGSAEESGDGDAAQTVRISLDDPRLAQVSVPARPDAVRVEQPLPALGPGAQASVSFPLESLPAQVFIQVDPQNRVNEIREGNNTAVHRVTPRPVMVALHTHASLSEGKASVDTQMDLMSRTGYDAVFWTEHDWRLQGTGFPGVYSFEDQPSGGTWMTMLRSREADMEGDAQPSSLQSSHGSRSLQLYARRTPGGRSEPGDIGWRFRAARSGHIRSLAQGLSLAFDIYPDPENPFDSEFTLELSLSRQPAVQRRLRYRIEAVPRSGAPRQVILPSPMSPDEEAIATIEPGRWTRLVVPVTAHARGLFAEAMDNALTEIRMGLSVHQGEASWHVDALELETAIQGDPLLALQETWTGFYPALASHVSTEISYYIPHFNAYTDQRFILDYTKVDQKGYINAAGSQTRQLQGALALAHPLGFSRSYATDQVEDQLRHRLFAADLLEAGYRLRAGADLKTHLNFWDRALAQGIPVSGVGVTDAHGPGRGNGFSRDENNFATWLGWFGGLSDEPAVDPASRSSLVDALLRGNLAFGDPLLFHGRLRLELDEANGPGAVILGPSRTHEAVLAGDGLPAGGNARLIVDGDTLAEATVDSTGGCRLEATVPATAMAVRAEVWDARGEPVVFSNAILLLNQLPPEGLTASRLRAETPRGTLTGRGRYRVEHLEVDEGGLVLRGGGGTGQLRLEKPGGEPAVVTALDSGSAVRWTYDAQADVLTLPLQGSGLTLRWSSPAAELARSRGFLLALGVVALALVLWWVFRPRGTQA